MATIVKPEWFGRKISVVMVNGKTLTGELAEVTDNFIVVEGTNNRPVQIMTHAIVAISPTGPEEESAM